MRFRFGRVCELPSDTDIDDLALTITTNKAAIDEQQRLDAAARAAEGDPTDRAA